MTQDEIIEMAKQAHGPLTGTWWDMDIAALDRFAKLVAAKERERMIYSSPQVWIETAIKAEREACAKVCDAIDKSHWGCEVKASWCSDAIRARGEA